MKISDKKNEQKVIKAKTVEKANPYTVFKWWLSKDKDVKNDLINTVIFLKDNQAYRQRSAALYAKLYGNQTLFSFIGSNINKIDQSHGIPLDRPTFNLVQSCVDTLVSRISQSRPAPTFLTDNGDYRERRLAKQLNNFILGEFHNTNIYRKTATMLRDALVTGDGILKVFRNADDKVDVERVLLTELFVDQNEAMYGNPRRMYRVKLVDRDVLRDSFGAIADSAEKAYPDSSSDASKSVSDLVMVVEGWSLPSGKDTNDGRHTIACSSGILLDESYKKSKFPFVFLNYSERLLGFWSQGLAEQLMGTQLEINSLLYTISKAIKLVGVPRVFVEAGSKVTKTSFNNDVGAIITYTGIKPDYEVAPAVPQEMYAQLQRLIDYGYQQSGVSALAAASQKPAGLESGEAIRSFDEISTDRFASLSKKYDNVFVDLAYLMIAEAKEICEELGTYKTIFPDKHGIKQIDLPKFKSLDDDFVIQCFNMSSLPRDPAGRRQHITEYMQAGLMTPKEGRRLLDFPDLAQDEILANAAEERIFQILDDIVDSGKYIPPDSFMDLELAKQFCVDYINLYTASALEESKCELLRNWYAQIIDLMSAAAPPQMGAPQPGGSQMATPNPLPQSPMLPNTGQG
jgi:hypothetical protein